MLVVMLIFNSNAFYVRTRKNAIRTNKLTMTKKTQLTPKGPRKPKRLFAFLGRLL
jgi:hypothetical protein